MRATTFVRKQVYIERRQDEALKRLATEQGISEVEIIRGSIEELLHENLRRARSREAWARLKLAMSERARMIVPQTGRAWTRDDLYDDRPGRFSR